MADFMKIQELYFEGNMEAAPALSGQSVGLIHEIKTVKQIIDEIIIEFNQVCNEMGKYKF